MMGSNLRMMGSRRKHISDRIYRGIIGTCAVILIFFGVYFMIMGSSMMGSINDGVKPTLLTNREANDTQPLSSAIRKSADLITISR